MFHLYKFERLNNSEWWDVGIAFYLTGDKRFVNDFRQIKGYVEAKSYVFGEMIDVILINLERFLTESHFSLETFATETALDRCKKGLAWMSDNKRDIDGIVRSIIAIHPYMVTLSQSVPPEKYGDAVMQVEMLREFCKRQKERLNKKQ